MRGIEFSWNRRLDVHACTVSKFNIELNCIYTVGFEDKILDNDWTRNASHRTGGCFCLHHTPTEVTEVPRSLEHGRHMNQ